MRKQLFLSFATLLIAILPFTLAAQTGDVPVTTTIDDYEAAIAPKLHIQSDKKGVYKNTKNVQSLIQGIGDWELDAYTSKFSDRQAYLDFSEPIAQSRDGQAPVAIPSGVYKARFISKCNEYGNNMFNLPQGQTMNCPLFVRFDYNGASYRIHFDPYNPNNPFPTTNYVSITCTSADANARCNQWKIEPSGFYTGADGLLKKRNVGRLVKIVSSKGQTTLVNQGDF
jgi:hypothetical protein